MKKLLFTLAVTVLSTASFAQKDISVTLNSPAAGTNFEVNVPIATDLTITNVGPDTLFAVDTVVYGYTLDGTLLAAYLAERPNDTVVPGESWTISENIEFSVLSASAAVDFCVVALFADSTVTETDITNNRSCVSVQTTEGNTAGVDGLKWQNVSINAFPNPAVDVVTFEVTGTTDVRNVTITNLAGQVVVNQEIISGVAKVDVSSLESGMYIYTVYGEDKVLGSQKLMVK